MSTVSELAAVDHGGRQRAAGWAGGLALLFCCWVPLLLTVMRLVATARDHAFAFDFHHYYWASGRAVLDGRSPFAPPTPDAVLLTHTYPAGPYPAPVAILFAPFGLLPVWLADVIFTAILFTCLFYALRLLGVRDWRCYGAALLWAPVGFGVPTPWARGAGLVLGIAALAGVFIAARRSRSEAASFTLALAAALLLTPIVWLHYFALLLVPLAIFSPGLSVSWLLP